MKAATPGPWGSLGIPLRQEVGSKPADVAWPASFVDCGTLYFDLCRRAIAPGGEPVSLPCSGRASQSSETRVGQSKRLNRIRDAPAQQPSRPRCRARLRERSHPGIMGAIHAHILLVPGLEHRRRHLRTAARDEQMRPRPLHLVGPRFLFSGAACKRPAQDSMGANTPMSQAVIENTVHQLALPGAHAPLSLRRQGYHGKHQSGRPVSIFASFGAMIHP